MLDPGRISSVQLIFLFIINESATGFLFPLPIAAAVAGADAWLSGLLTSVYGLLIAVVCLSLAKRFPSQVFTEYLPQVLGKIPGKLLAAVFSLVMLHACIISISQSSTYIHVVFFKETPTFIIDIFFVIAAVYGAYLGIEAIARQGNITLPFFILVAFVVMLLFVKDLDLNNLRPFMENGVFQILKGSGAIAVWRGEIFFLLMLYPYLNQPEEAAKAAVIALIFMGLLAALVFGECLALFGEQLTSQLVFPMHNAARYISAGDILERIDLYLVIFWIAITTVKLALFFHIASIAVSSTLGLKNYRLAVIPVGVIAVIGSNAFYNHNYLRLETFIGQIMPVYGGIIQLLLPGLVLLVAVITKKGGAGHGPNQEQSKPS